MDKLIKLNQGIEGAPSSPASQEATPKTKVEILAEGVAVNADRIKGEKVRLEKIYGKYRMKNLTTWKWLIGEETEDGRRR